MQGISVSFSGIFCVFLNFYKITHQVEHKKKKKNYFSFRKGQRGREG